MEIPICTTTPIEVFSLDKNFDLEELLQCPVCLELRKPPIFQCIEGHTICHICRPQVKGKCPVCREKVPKGLRNRALETIYNNALFSCSSKDYGCKKIVRGDKFEAHLQVCSYRLVMCKFVNDARQCGLNGNPKLHSLQQFQHHFMNDHGISVYNSGQYCSHEESLHSDVDIPLALWKFNGHIFLEKVRVRENILHLSIMILPFEDSEKTETEEYFVDMQLIRKGFDCAPNIRKAILPMRVCPFAKESQDISLEFDEHDFKTNVARNDPSSAKFCWISRIDFKIRGRPLK